MEVLFTKGKTVEKGDSIFFRPIDSIWGLYGARAKQAGLDSYYKNSLFLNVSYRDKPADVLKKPVNLKARIADLNQDVTIGWAFTIISIEGLMSDYVVDETPSPGKGKFDVDFQINVELVTTETVTDLLNRPGLDKQLGPILVLDKATILAYKPAEMVVRIGQYDDGRYVLFLHGEEHEVNNPTRIPSE